MHGHVTAACALPYHQPLQEIEQELLDSIRAVEDYAQGNPNVDNVGKLTRRIKRDLAYIRALAAQPPAQLTETRWQARLVLQQPGMTRSTSISTRGCLCGVSWR